MENLSLDFAKAAEALRAWGLVEGEDLGVSFLPEIHELLFNEFPYDRAFLLLQHNF